MAQRRRQLQASSAQNHFRSVRLLKEQELGHGAFATVCRAECDSLLCAAKVLHDGFFKQGDPGEENFVAKFLEECNILPSITHPNIVQCFGTYQDPDTNLPVLLMELMDESLTGYLEQAREPLPYHIEVSFSYDVALGLSYLHSRGYVHRDLSSNNVLIMAGVRAKITDFGMCRAMAGPNRTPSRLTQCPGTLVYMPPEALVEPPFYSDKIDVFSLGVLMIQVMSRQYPNPGSDRRMIRTMLHQAIPEDERRANHISRIHQDHPILPLAKQCIQNSYRLRPLSDDICSVLRSLKESRFYQQNKYENSVERKLERAEFHCQRRLTEQNQAFHKQLVDIQGENLLVIENVCGKHKQELKEKDMNHEFYCQQLQAKHNEEIERIRGEFTQDIENIHCQYQEKLRQHESSNPKHSTITGFSLDSFDPSNLPEPAFDSNELEMLHQKVGASGLTARNSFPKPPSSDSHPGNPLPSMLIDARSREFDDFSGPNLDDHLSFRFHNEGPAIMPQSNAAEDDDEIESPSLPMPKPRPRSYSGGKKQPDEPKADKKPQAMPRPMSQQNLLSTKNPTPPRIPQRDKPVAAPRRKKVSPSDTPVVREPDPQAMSETLPSIDNNDEVNTMSTCSSSNITSIHTISSSSVLPSDLFNDDFGPESLQHAEAHTSHESDSPHPSLEQSPGTSFGNASSGEKVFTETNVEDSLGSWVEIEVENKESHSQPSSLDGAPMRIRNRAKAFSTRPEKPNKKPVTPYVSEIYLARLVRQLSHDTQHAIPVPCWYCTNLTTDRICDVCGNEQKQSRHS